MFGNFFNWSFSFDFVYWLCFFFLQFSVPFYYILFIIYYYFTNKVNWEYVRVLPSGETVSIDGTHLGHNLPDTKGRRYCINLVSIAGYPTTTTTQSNKNDEEEEEKEATTTTTKLKNIEIDVIPNTSFHWNTGSQHVPTKEKSFRKSQSMWYGHFVYFVTITNLLVDEYQIENFTYIILHVLSNSNFWWYCILPGRKALQDWPCKWKILSIRTRF